jgi:hypothetical protein
LLFIYSANMNERKEFLYYIEVKERDGKRTRYPIYRDDKNYYIRDHLVKAGKSIEDEIKDFFKVEVIGPILEKPIHQDLKFKKIE